MLIRSRSREEFPGTRFKSSDRSSLNHPRSDLSAWGLWFCVASSTRREVEFVLRKEIGVDVGKLLPRVRGRVHRGCVEIRREQLADIDARPVEVFLRRGITETRLDRRSINLNRIVAADENSGHPDYVRKRPDERVVHTLCRRPCRRESIGGEMRSNEREVGVR